MAEQVFAYFSKLPPEIRVMVWQTFLESESKYRRILVNINAEHLLPETQLISPLLNVTTESRATALKFYNMKLVVFDTYLKGTFPIPTEPEKFSFFPKGHFYVNAMKDNFCRSDYGMIDGTQELLLEERHFRRTFTKDAPDVTYVGPLTERVPDEYLPLQGLPNWNSDYEEL
ncbi:hypothetical protein PG995_003430 [Apiospora arundinis]|uniref:2EXR domain-containing protein n=1 Tax=Apiospora arundinis TaxID=335852 RepID=A0ABR2HRZ5_9PEZI